MNTYIGYQQQTKNSSIVYWIHAKKHNNINTEGYVGITKQPAMRRWKDHQSASRKNNELHCKILNKALRKYDSLIFEVILVADLREYCERIEGLLRPKQRIGWNIATGGMPVDTMLGGIATRNKWIQYWIDNPNKAAEKKQILLKKQANKQLNKQLKAIKELNKPKPFTNNKTLSAKNKSGYRGVVWYSKYSKWKAQIGMTPKVICLGYFDSKEQANQTFLKANASRLMWRQGQIDRDMAITQIINLQINRTKLETKSFL
tara:strand:+ start:1831 stop:2610 length:780 start_codon:yes stop_codon:yes gene_type:complete